MYEILANYYQALVDTTQGTKYFYALLQKFNVGDTVLDCACGTGDLVEHLLLEEYDAFGFDLSEKMLEKVKHPNRFKVFNMTNFHYAIQFDCIVCFCDSLNYLLTLKDVQLFFENVYKHLKDGGMFIFDMHRYDTLDAFQEEFDDVGIIDGITYQWQIVAQNELLHHTFIFDDVKEEHIQRVYTPQIITQLLHEIGFQVEIVSDEILQAYAEEKVVIVAKKEQI